MTYAVILVPRSFDALRLLRMTGAVQEWRMPVRIDYFREFELIAVWIILLIGWIVYLFRLWKNKK